MGSLIATPRATSRTCPQCRGQGVVMNNGSQLAQVCPLCDGSGQNYDPGLDFRYELGPYVLGAGAAQKGNATNVLDADFRARMITRVMYMPNNVPFVLPFLFQLYSGVNKRPFANQQLHSENWLGTNTNPFPMLTPFVFPRLAPIIVDITDLAGVNPPAYNAGATYTPGQVVTNAGVTYICIVGTTGNAPPNAAFWAVYSNTVRITLHGEEINQG